MKRFFTAFVFLFFFFFGLAFDAKAGIFDWLYKTKDILSVKGRDIFFNDNKIILRGVAVGDSHSRAEIYHRSVDDFITIKKDWQANVVRISVLPGAFKNEERETKRMLEREVAAAREQGLFVIVDWHVIGTPDGWYEKWDWGEKNGFSFESSFRMARNFWKYLAGEYRGDRGVVFEIWNEPANKEKRIYWKDIKPYMKELHDTIRAEGADNIIIVPGVYWTYDLRQIKNNPLRGDNIAYAWHVYPISDNFISWDMALDGLDEKYPVVITEWGYTNNQKNRNHYSAENDYPAKFKNYIVNHDLHFTAWAWHNPWDPRMFEGDWETLTTYGRYVKKFLADNVAGKLKKTIAAKKTDQVASVREKIITFIHSGLDANTAKCSQRERGAWVSYYQQSYGSLPRTENDLSDLLAIASGRYPEKRSALAEKNATNTFKYIFNRAPDLKNKTDERAVLTIAYGLAWDGKRDLSKEKAAITRFKELFNRYPATSREWAIVRVLAYCGGI